MEHNKNNPKDEIDELLYDYFKNHDEDVPIETSKAIDEALYKKKHSSFKLSKIAAIILLCFTMTTGLIFAKDIINFFSEIFDLKSTNIDNSGIVDAIANKNYIQNVDMDYIPIDDNYSIKVDYLMLDDLNLYLVFNLHSNKEIDEDYRISITDLVLTDQDGNVIYNGNNYMFKNNNQILCFEGYYKLDKKNNNLRELFYLITNGIHNLKTLNLSFSNLILYYKDTPNKKVEIKNNTTFSIDIIDKFINKDIYIFYTNEINKDFKIEKCIITDTGMYLLYKTNNFNVNFNFNNIYNYHILLGVDEQKQYNFINYYNITKDSLNNINSISLNEIYTNKEILLYKY